MKCINNFCNNNSRSNGKNSKGLCRVCQNKKQKIFSPTNNEINQPENYNCKVKRGRPLKDDNYCTSTVNRKFIKIRKL